MEAHHPATASTSTEMQHWTRVCSLLASCPLVACRVELGAYLSWAWCLLFRSKTTTVCCRWGEMIRAYDATFDHSTATCEEADISELDVLTVFSCRTCKWLTGIPYNTILVAHRMTSNPSYPSSEEGQEMCIHYLRGHGSHVEVESLSSVGAVRTYNSEYMCPCEKRADMTKVYYD